MTEGTHRVYQPSADVGKPHECTQKEMFEKIDRKLDIVVNKLEEGNIKFATILLRLKILEAIVYGAVVLGLIAIVGLVLKSIGMKP